MLGTTSFAYAFPRHNLYSSSMSLDVAYAFAEDNDPLTDSYGKISKIIAMGSGFHVTLSTLYAINELLRRHVMKVPCILQQIS